MNAPTLLIGLGGAGCKIVERVSKIAEESGGGSNIACVAFDTDINDLRGIQERNPFIRTVQTSTKQTVGEYLNRDIHARDTWFPVNAIINGKTLTEGAGQVRAISRLALDSVIKAGKMEPLHKAIQSLYKVEEDKKEQALRVEIVSSLAGGTGSGLILPVALYVRNYLKAHFRLSANIARGFFILPEVFYEVIPGEAERNNLKANAYATLRELDAFLMKGDKTLQERYADSVKMEFPLTASSGYEEYNVLPFDFCFLFDAQNADGGKLNSYSQYLDHAANCIYAQSIGPMNLRSNSSEDNTIRSLARERGRNRYAGAGASRLIYPFADIRTLLALNWAKQCVSTQWMQYDNRYKEMAKENAEKRDKGIMVRETSLSAFYVNQIESSAKMKESFAKAIHQASGYYTNGVTREADRWQVYLDAVLEKIKTDINDPPLELTCKRTGVVEMINSLSNEWVKYVSTYKQMKEYRLMSQVFVEEIAPTIGYSMFSGAKPGTGDHDLEYMLESNLVDADGNFMHPNAIRFLLIKILDSMKAEKESLDSELLKDRKFFDDFEKNTFDVDQTDEVVDTVDSLADRKVSTVSKLTHQLTADQEDLKDKYRGFMGRADEYNARYAQSAVLSQGIEYIGSIIASLESCYKSFESKIEALDRGISDIYKKYSVTKGNTVRYVCTSRKCLDEICKKKVYTGGAVSIDSNLAKEIYIKVCNYAMQKEKPNNNRYFNELFDKGIIGYFENAVMKDYGEELDVDVVTAIENEANFEKLFEEKDNAYELIDQYVRKVIEDTRNLSCPFIEKALGETRDPIYSCTFNKDALKPKDGDDSPKANLLRQELMNHGGAPDNDIPKNVIMFYQSFYSLRANDLSKFAPPEKALTCERNGGEYFKAYYELVSKVHPEAHRSRELNPHIDKWWHIITKMPDLDDENQKKQENELYAAFFWAIVNNYIKLTEEGNDIKVYKLTNILLGMEDDSLIVSNGTECDKLYEVLDAVAIYPELIHKILDSIESHTRNDVNDYNKYSEGVLYRALDKFHLAEPGVGNENEPACSIFDLPLLMKKTSSAEVYYEAGVVEMLKVEIEEVKKYLANFCTKKELPEIAGQFIMEHFDRHLKTVAIESRLHPSIYKDSLFEKTCDTVYTALMNLGRRRDAEQVKEKIAEAAKSVGINK